MRLRIGKRERLWGLRMNEKKGSGWNREFRERYAPDAKTLPAALKVPQGSRRTRRNADSWRFGGYGAFWMPPEGKPPHDGTAASGPHEHTRPIEGDFSTLAL
jgi:hypothetical protein